MQQFTQLWWGVMNSFEPLFNQQLISAYVRITSIVVFLSISLSLYLSLSISLSLSLCGGSPSTYTWITTVQQESIFTMANEIDAIMATGSL
jgi:hypothetical protein